MTQFLSLAVALDGAGLGILGVGIGLGVLVFGAARGISNIGANAVQSTARQPEAATQIFLQMIISAALIEGFTFFGIIVAQNLGKGLFPAA
ncbi:MAG: ATP synthase F0 subunit C [Phycisphaeraceae bacterium]|nr:ATP synthase F0 subunit C [Phycisphaeraceae bacterium]